MIARGPVPAPDTCAARPSLDTRSAPAYSRGAPWRTRSSSSTTRSRTTPGARAPRSPTSSAAPRRPRCPRPSCGSARTRRPRRGSSRPRASARSTASIEDDPVGVLGPEVCDRFGNELPFLLKVLAAAEPLSIQAHPSHEQARRGWARENAEGVPVDAPRRNYRDPNHKPELVCALTPFVALKGFRPLDEIARSLEPVARPELAPELGRARARADAARPARALRPPHDARPRGAARRCSARDAARPRAGARPIAPGPGWRGCLTRYPGDVGRARARSTSTS